jgi:hypothetical protein
VPILTIMGTLERSVEIPSKVILAFVAVCLCFVVDTFVFSVKVIRWLDLLCVLGRGLLDVRDGGLPVKIWPDGVQQFD